MKIVGLKKYRHGYAGIMETVEEYAFFHLAQGRFRVLSRYRKKNFEDRDHFISVMGRFARAGSFFKTPIEIDAPTEAELDRVLALLDKPF